MTERMCETERERGRGGRETRRITKDRRRRETERGTETEKKSYRERGRGGDRQRQSRKDTHRHTRARTHARTPRKREREGGRARKNKHVRHIIIMLQNVQDAAWNETSHPQSVHVYLLSHQTIPAIQSNKDIHNTQSNHIFTQRESIKKSPSMSWFGNFYFSLQIFAHPGAFSRPASST